MSEEDFMSVTLTLNPITIFHPEITQEGRNPVYILKIDFHSQTTIFVAQAECITPITKPDNIVITFPPISLLTSSAFLIGFPRLTLYDNTNKNMESLGTFLPSKPPTPSVMVTFQPFNDPQLNSHSLDQDKPGLNTVIQGDFTWDPPTAKIPLDSGLLHLIEFTQNDLVIPPQSTFLFFSRAFLISPRYAQQPTTAFTRNDFLTFLLQPNNVLRDPESDLPHITSHKVLKHPPSSRYFAPTLSQNPSQTSSKDDDDLVIIPTIFPKIVAKCVDSFAQLPRFHFGPFPIAKSITVKYHPIAALPSSNPLIGFYLRFRNHHNYTDPFPRAELTSEVSNFKPTSNLKHTSPLISHILPYFWLPFVNYELSTFRKIHNSAAFLGPSTMSLLNYCLGDQLVNLTRQAVGTELSFFLSHRESLDTQVDRLFNSDSEESGRLGLKFGDTTPTSDFSKSSTATSTLEQSGRGIVPEKDPQIRTKNSFLQDLIPPSRFHPVLVTFDSVYSQQYLYWSTVMSSGLGWMPPECDGSSLHELAMLSFQSLLIEHAALTYQSQSDKSNDMKISKNPSQLPFFPSFASIQTPTHRNSPRSNQQLSQHISFADHFTEIASRFVPEALTKIPPNLLYTQLNRAKLTDLHPVSANKDCYQISNLLEAQSTLLPPPPKFQITLTHPTTPPHLILNMLAGYSILPPLARLRDCTDSITSTLLKSVSNYHDVLALIDSAPSPYGDGDKYQDIQSQGTKMRRSKRKISYRLWCLLWLFYGHELYPHMIDYQRYHHHTLAKRDDQGKPIYRWRHLCIDFPVDFTSEDGTLVEGYSILHESLFAAMWILNQQSQEILRLMTGEIEDVLKAKDVSKPRRKLDFLTPIVSPSDAKVCSLDRLVQLVWEKLCVNEMISEQNRRVASFAPQNITISQAMDVIDFTTTSSAASYEYHGTWFYQTMMNNTKKQKCERKSSFLRNVDIQPDEQQRVREQSRNVGNDFVTVQLPSTYQPFGLVFAALNISSAQGIDDIPTLLHGHSVMHDSHEITLINPSFIISDPNTSRPFSDRIVRYRTEAKVHSHAELLKASSTALYTLLNHEIFYEINIVLGTTTIRCELLLYAILRRANESILGTLFNNVDDKSILANLTHKVYKQSRRDQQCIFQRESVGLPFTDTQFTNDPSDTTTHYFELTFETALYIAGTHMYAPTFATSALESLKNYR